MSNAKHQIPNKSQIPISKDPNRFVILNFGHCNLFFICHLVFFTETQKFTIKLGALPASGGADT
jgi:hypothetical protein